MSLWLKIVIAILSVIVAVVVVLGDSVLHNALGFPRYFGRAAFLILLTLVIAIILGLQWLAERARERRRQSDKSDRR